MIILPQLLIQDNINLLQTKSVFLAEYSSYITIQY